MVKKEAGGDKKLVSLFTRPKQLGIERESVCD